MEETEKLMAEKPELFTAEEIKDFNDNKSTFKQAPDVVESYKKKINEFDELNEKSSSMKRFELFSSNDRPLTVLRIEKTWIIYKKIWKFI